MWDSAAPPQGQGINVKVINVTKVNEEYTFARKSNMWSMSCQLTSSISIAFLDAAGEWIKFNISPDVLEVGNKNESYRESYIKVCLLLSGKTYR